MTVKVEYCDDNRPIKSFELPGTGRSDRKDCKLDEWGNLQIRGMGSTCKIHVDHWDEFVRLGTLMFKQAKEGRGC